MTVKVVKLDSEAEIVGNSMNFATVEQAQKWCELERNAKLQWGEEGRFFSLEGMTPDEEQRLVDEGEYPRLRFWIVGVEDDGEERELIATDFETPDDGEWPVKEEEGGA
jgi:hypothetical protein